MWVELYVYLQIFYHNYSLVLLGQRPLLLFNWAHWVVTLVCCWWATHSLPTEVGTGALWVETGTHPCDDPPKQDGEPSERTTRTIWDSLQILWGCIHKILFARVCSLTRHLVRERYSSRSSSHRFSCLLSAVSQSVHANVNLFLFSEDWPPSHPTYYKLW